MRIPPSLFRGPLITAVCLALCLLAGVGDAVAAGSPEIGLSVEAPATVLYGANATVTLSASNPAGQPYGYNLSYRAVLPAGISYVAGSGRANGGSSAQNPQVIANKPLEGQTTLIWTNLSDLSPSSHGTLSFEVSHSTTTYTVGNSYKVEAGAYIASEPRYLPKFNADGTPNGPSSTSFTGSATGSASTTISAIHVTQSEPSPEGEILRGVHDHQTEYTVTVTNTNVNSTSGVVVDDWLPAGLEYLGCGGAGMDHTKSAPTNLGSAEEYPGSGLITASTLAGCQTPTSVATEQIDPDGAGTDPNGSGSLPNAVYTHVQWILGTIPAGGTVTLKFRAAVPIRANTTTWTGKTPTATSAEQAANLDNNSGTETTDGEALKTFAAGSGKYTGTVPVSDTSYLTRVAKDLTIEKSGSSGALNEGQITHWTLHIHSSEYRYNTAITVTDTLPNGMCPLGSRNFTGETQASDSECASTGNAEDLPSSEYAVASEGEAGSWELEWTSATDPALAKLEPNATMLITFASKTRRHYQAKHADAAAVLANDSLLNTVLAKSTTNVVCGGDTDCTAPESKPIAHDRPPSEPISDNSSASQTAAGPTIAKEIAEASTPDCTSDKYTTATPVYHPGDLICWKLNVTFPNVLDTQGDEVTDFLPLDAAFDAPFNAGAGEAPTASDSLPGTTFNSSQGASSVLKWALPNGGSVSSGGQVFDRVIATIASLPAGAQPGDIHGNLMKFANSNTPGESFSQRAEANFALQFPQLTLSKRITAVNGGTVTPTQTANVQAGDKATFTLTLTNSGQATAEHAEVWDELPSGLTCAEISSVSGGGECASGRITWGNTGLGQPAVTVSALSSSTLTFIATVSSGVDPNTALTDHAGVRRYISSTNTGGSFTYVPTENIDPMITTEFPEGPNAVKADDKATLQLPDASVAKTHTSEIETTGNSAAQATIGELVNFKVAATVPAGTTLSGTAKLTDPGVPGSGGQFAYVPGSETIEVEGAPSTGFVNSESATTPAITFPSNYAVVAHEPNVVVIMRFQAYVTNVAANKSAVEIANTGVLGWTDPTTGAQTRTAENKVPVVEPSIVLSETNNTKGAVHGGQLVEYALKLTNGATASPAYDNVVVETVPSGLTPTDSEGHELADKAKTADGGEWSASARTITWTLATLASNSNKTFHFFATVNDPPVAGSSLIDHSVATTSSMPGENTHERTFPTAPGTTGTPYHSETKNELKVSGATIAKSSDSAEATIGHEITYTIKVTLPAHVTSFDNTVIDTLPDSLEFDGYTSAICTTGCPPEAEPTVHTYTPSISKVNGTTMVAWDLGSLTSTEKERVVTLTYKAHVRATHRSGGAEVLSTGPSIKNSATVNYDLTKKLTFNEAVIPPTSGFENKGAAVSATTIVIEPALTIAKAISVNGGTSSHGPVSVTDGDSVGYTLTVTNSSKAPAYNVKVVDKHLTNPPGESANDLTEVKATTNSAFVTSSSAHEIVWTIPGPIETGKPLTLGYEGKLIPVSGLHNADKLVNTAEVPLYFGVSETERLANKFTYREYTKDPTDTVTATVALPTISIVKNTGTEGTQTSANAEVNQPFTWRVNVTNTSTVAAKALKVTDTLPANWEYVAKSASFAPGGEAEPGVVTVAGVQQLTWSTAIELAPKASTVLTYRAKPTLAAELTPGSGAGNPNVNSASASVSDVAGHTESAEGPFAAGPAHAQGVLQIPGLEISKTPLHASIASGEPDSYAIVIHNAGEGTARELAIADTLPAGMSYEPKAATAAPTTGFEEQSASGSSLAWSIVSLAPGATVTITVPVKTEATLAAGEKLVNHVSVSSVEQPTPVTAAATITTTTSADLKASKTAATDPVTPGGGDETYTMSVLNKGPSVARAVTLSDPLPAGTTFVSADAGCAAVAGTVECAAGDLAPASEASYHVKVSVERSVTSAITNTATVKSTTPDPEPKNNLASVKVGVSPTADLALVKTALTPSVLDGQQAKFSLKATNNGPSDATEAQIVDTLPAGLSFVSSTGVECSATGQKVTCPLGTLANGASTTVELVVGTSGTGSHTNTAVVESAASDPKPSDNESSASVEVEPAADLALEKTATPTNVTVPAEISYTLTATNHGPDTAHEAKITDTLPTGETFASGDAGCSASGQTVTCELGDMLDKAVVAVHIKVGVALALANQTVVNTAQVSSQTEDPEPADNTAEAELFTGAAADLELVKTALTPSVLNGQQAKFSLKATNNGPSEAAEAQIVDTLPSGLSFVSSTGVTCSAAGQEVTCPLGALANGATQTVELVVETAGAGPYTNTAVLESPTHDPKPADNESSAPLEVEPAADLSLEKTVAPLTVMVPGEVTYTLTATNHGPDTAHEAKITDTLPTGETFASGDAGCSASGQTVTCELGDMLDTAVQAVHIQVLVPISLANRSVTNTAQVSSPTGDPEPVNNTASAELSTGPAADLALVKTGPASVVTGGAISWTLQVVNHGPSVAHEVLVLDPLPAGVSFQSAVPSRGACSLAAGQLSCTLGTLADGAEAQITVMALAPEATGTLVNTATVSATEPDGKPSDNTSSASTEVAVPESSGVGIPLTGSSLPKTTGSAPSTGSRSPGGKVGANNEAFAPTRVTLTKMLRQRRILPGEDLQYRLTIHNVGAHPAMDPIVCDRLPSQVSVLALRGGHLARGQVCFSSLAELAAGHRHTFVLVLRADDSAQGQILNRANVTGANFRAARASVTRPVIASGVAPQAYNGVTG
jgi:fimbrial isopeptide formation D2 family protein/uncharacterized repeat protein (TIGR01451 family)